jgi:predicted transcriptional regulator
MKKTNYIKLFENFISDDKFFNIEKFLMNIDITTNKLNSDKLFVFYRNVIKTMFLSKFEKEIETLTRHLKLLKNAANSRDNRKIAEALSKIKYVLQIDDSGVTPWISPNNVELYLSKSTPRKIGNLHEELINIMKDFGVIN